MAIIDMKKLLLIGLESEKQSILEYLQDRGSVEITDMDETDEFMDIENSADAEHIDKLFNQLQRLSLPLKL